MVNWIVCALALAVAASAAPVSDEKMSQILSGGQIRPQFECAEVGGDGNYAFGCSSTFYQCSNGLRHNQQCRKDNAFDPDTNACELPKSVRVCQSDLVSTPKIVKASQMADQTRQGGNAPAYTTEDAFTVPQSPPVLPQQPQIEAANYNAQGQLLMAPPVLPRQQKQEEPLIQGKQPRPQPTGPQFDCSTRADGVYPAPQGGCVNFFWKCAHGQAFEYKCPPGLFFAVAFVECHRRADVPECNGQQQQSPPTDSRPLEWKPATPGNQEGLVPDQTLPLAQALISRTPQLPVQPRGTYQPQQPQQPIQQAPPAQPRETYQQQPQQPVQQAPAQPRDTYQPQQPQQPIQQAPPAQPRDQYVPQQPQQPQQPIQQAPPAAPVETWCQQNNAVDGYQGQGCSAHYWYCAAGTTTKMVCPAGLWFDSESHACDHKNVIPACGGQRPVQADAPQNIGDHGNFNTHYQHTQQPQPLPAQPRSNYQPQQPIQQAPPAQPRDQYVPQQPQQPQQSPPQTTFDCSKLADGFYEQGKCQANYVHCANGIAHARVCPASLVFGNEMCDYKDSCLTPATQQPIQQAPPAQPRDTYQQPQQPQQPIQQPRAQYQPQQPAQVLPAQPNNAYTIQQTPPAAPVETWCQQNNAVDGYQGQGCSAHYWYCAAGTTTKMVCPAGLWFDSESHACDHKNVIPACGGQRPTQPPQQAQPQPNPYGVQQAPPAPVDNHCSRNNLADGFHAQGCSNHYYHCSVGVTTRMACPHGLWFDVESQVCDHKNLIPACGGQRPTQPPQQAQPQPNPYGVQQAPPAQTDNFCQRNNLNSGFHGTGCRTHFYVCSAGSTTKISCPAGLWYDNELHTCDHKNLIVACGGQRPTQPPQQSQPLPPNSQYGSQPQQPQQTYQQPAQQAPARPAFDCSGKTDGLYVNGCSAQYFACNHGSALALNCPTGTFYSTHSERCDFEQHVVECGGQVPTQAPPSRNPVMLPQQPQYGQPQQAPAQPRDQYVPQQPQPQPQQPIQQAPAPVTPVPAWVAHPYPQTQPQQPAVQAQQPQQPQPQTAGPTQIESPNTNPCLNLNNGIYGRKCSRFFFVCTNFKTYDFICPKKQAFNTNTSKCAPRETIETCSEFVAQPQPQQQAPVAQNNGY